MHAEEETSRRIILLVVDSGRDAYTQMALDEAMAAYAGLRGAGLARLYWFDPAAVSIGYFQRLSEAVDIEEAERLGVTVVRRLTGGGSVYHDPRGELVYSVAVPVEWLGSMSVRDSMGLLASWVVEALSLLGVRAEFSGSNDVVVEGYKVSGNAQARRYGAVLQHGTILVDPDVGVMRRVLRVPRVKGRRVETRVAGLSRFKPGLSREMVIDAMRAAFRRLAGMLGAEAREEPHLPRAVLELGEALRWRYASREWLERRP